jgi:hypothetical protein
MGAGSIEYNIDTPYTITATNAVGPTTDTTIRPNSDLPWPDARSTGTPDYDTINKDNDANTIYLDPENGDDANGGTDLSSDAKLTFASALAAVTATRHTIHIEGTSTSATTLAETLSGETAMTTNLDNIQVASGQTCVFTMTGGNYAWANPTPGIIHGLEVVQTGENDAPFESGNQYEYCKLDVPQHLIVMATGSMVFNNSIGIVRSGSTGAEPISTQAKNVTITESVIYGLGSATTMADIGQASQVLTIDIQHFVAIGFTNVFNVINAVTSITTTANDSHIIHNCGTIWLDSSGNSVSTTITNSLLNVASGGAADITDSTNVRDQNPLFLDQDNFDFRLAHIGRTVDGVNYPVTSPAVGIGLSDAGAWLHTYSAGSETESTFTFLDDIGFDSVKLIGERSNYQKFQDIQGRYFNTHDGVNYRVELELSRRYYTGNSWSYELLEICRQTGAMRFYPADYLPSGTSGTVVTVNDDTEIDITGLTRGLDTNQLVGWIISIKWTGTGAGTGWWQVGSNTSSRLSDMVHVRGSTGWSAVGATVTSVANPYLPVLLDANSITLISEYYSDDDTNDTFKPWYQDGTDEHVSEFHTRKIILRQTEAI